MTESRHLDEIHRLRYALWGPVDDDARRVEEHLFAEACEDCAREIAMLRGAQSAMERIEEPSAAVLRAVQDQARELLEPFESELFWFTAEPAPLMAGVRTGATADRQVVCKAGEYHLDVLMHPGGRDGRFAVSGQLLTPGDLPAPAVPVTLFIDRRPRTTTRTNGFGEFEFETHEGGHFGVRVGETSSARHIEVWSAEDLR